jgi:hypothetical protein
VTGGSIILPFMSSFFLVAGSQAAAGALRLAWSSILQTPICFLLSVQKLALQNKNEGTALMAGRILLAQVVMVPMAMMVGRKADFSGRKPLFLAGLAVPCLRGLLYPL